MHGLFDASSSTVPVRVSAAMMRLPFEGCSEDYIKTVCHGRCCHIKSLPVGTIIHLEQDQIKPLEFRGVVVKKGVMQTVDRKCVFHDKDGFCKIHFTPDKPRSCIQSPFILTKKDTLIVRNRYRMLCCFKAPPAIPAYKAFRAALDLLFGKEEASRICQHLDKSGGDIEAAMISDRYVFNKKIAGEWIGWK